MVKEGRKEGREKERKKGKEGKRKILVSVSCLTVCHFLKMFFEGGNGCKCKVYRLLFENKLNVLTPSPRQLLLQKEKQKIRKEKNKNKKQTSE